MPVDVTTWTDIARPRAEVAAFAADPGNAPRWYDNIDSVRWETTPPVAVGSRMAFVARFLGRRLAYTYEVRDLVPGERLVMSTAEGPFPMETTYTWADVAGGTRMTSPARTSSRWTRPSPRSSIAGSVTSSDRTWRTATTCCTRTTP